MTDTLTATLGARIRQARREAGYTNSESLAVLLKVGQRTVQRWETDKAAPSIAKLQELAAATGKPLGYFFTNDHEAAA